LSALALIFDPEHGQIDRPLFNRVMDRLNHRGPDGKKVVELDHLTIGHWHFWTTPEEVDEHQPFALPEHPYRIALDGRLDNREETITRLQLDSAKAVALSDASLILLAYDRWGEECFKDFVGVFALAIYDEDKNELICARDHLGDRTLFYTEKTNGQVIVASEPWAVAAACSTAPKPNPRTVAHFFDFKVPEDGASFYQGVAQLLPAHFMRITPTGVEIQRYWKPDLSKKIRYKTEEEYTHRFLHLLEESVRSRMRSTTPIAVSMSGGLDSTSIACLAAKFAAPEPVTAISSVFNELTACDEREYINPVTESCNLHAIHIPSDDDWVLKDFVETPQNPNHPELMLFPIAMRRIYARAHTAEMRVVFTGEFGDNLFVAGQEWLADYIEERRFRAAFAALRKQIKAKGLRYLWITTHFRSAIRILLERFAAPLLKVYRHLVYRENATWLTDFAKQRLSKKNVITGKDAPLQRNESLFGLRYAQFTSHENMVASRHHVELRYPYRDRRLVEYVMGLPAYMLHANGLYKHILRLAMRNLLPDKLLKRKKEMVLDPFFLRGFERESVLVQKYLFGDEKLAWHQFLKPELFQNGIANKLHLPLSRNLFLVRVCISYEVWYKFLTKQ